MVDCIGKSGALALRWNEEIDLQIQNYSRRHINATIKGVSDGVEWSLTSFYGHPEADKRHEASNLL